MRSHPNSSNLGENSCFLECCAEFTCKQSKMVAWPLKKESLLSIETPGTTHWTPNREIGILDYIATKIAKSVTTPTIITRLAVRRA